MVVTREHVARKILDYLNRKISANDLACWAETDVLAKLNYSTVFGLEPTLEKTEELVYA